MDAPPYGRRREPGWREDLAAQREGWLSHGFWALRVHRFGEARRRVAWRPLRAAWAVLYHAVLVPTRIVTGVHIGTGARIGRRFVIEHGFVVVNARAVIGDDVVVRPGVVIGNRHLDRPHAVPVVGNRVNIGAGAKLLGDIRVGDDAAIGANAVVLRDVPAGHVALGVPATVRPRAPEHVADGPQRVADGPPHSDPILVPTSHPGRGAPRERHDNGERAHARSAP